MAIENFSFELPGTDKQKGFDNVPGWNDELQENWECAQRHEGLKKIDPLV